MPREPRPPEPLREFRLSGSEAEALARFREQASLAATLFLIDPEAGRRRAVQAAWWLIRDLTDAPAVLMPFASVVERFHPHRSNTDPPAKWLKKVHVAAALDALIPIPGLSKQAAAVAVLGVVEELGVTLEGGRRETTGEARVTTLRLNLRAGKGDRGAVLAFERLSRAYADIGDGLADARARKDAVLDELRRNLVRLRQGPSGDRPRT